MLAYIRKTTGVPNRSFSFFFALYRVQSSFFISIDHAFDYFY
ncbi:hypothetical protein FH5_03367 [Priestia endophytica]|nr:hypothetical protein FH5_03367 [Priestia endophytica]